MLLLSSEDWWGWIAKVVAALWILGAVIALSRIDRSNHPIFGARAGGYLIAMPFFAIALWLDPGWIKFGVSFIFAFLNVTSFMILRRAMVASLVQKQKT